MPARDRQSGTLVQVPTSGRKLLIVGLPGAIFGSALPTRRRGGLGSRTEEVAAGQRSVGNPRGLGYSSCLSAPARGKPRNGSGRVERCPTALNAAEAACCDASSSVGAVCRSRSRLGSLRRGPARAPWRYAPVCVPGAQRACEDVVVRATGAGSGAVRVSSSYAAAVPIGAARALRERYACRGATEQRHEIVPAGLRAPDVERVSR
jgi:hypothetical protein